METAPFLDEQGIIQAEKENKKPTVLQHIEFEIYKSYSYAMM